MERASGKLLCACGKESNFVEGARFCMFCGSEYSTEAVFIAGQEARQEALRRRWVSRVLFGWFFAFLVLPNLGGDVSNLQMDGVIILGSLLLTLLVTFVVARYRAKKLYPIPTQVSKSP